MRELVTAAVIVAAGNSTRMGQPKQLLPLAGKPVLAHTLKAFQQCDVIKEIVVVARQEDVETFAALAEEWTITKMKAIVSGGNTRQQSVAAGVAVCSPDVALLAIHDGARPLIRPEDITRTVQAAAECGGATLAVPVKDTIKLADNKGYISHTPERSRLWSVQTPQVFRREVYLRALAQPGVEQLTDDCQLVERLGESVRLVEGSYTNIKITTPEDLVVAEELIKQ